MSAVQPDGFRSRENKIVLNAAYICSEYEVREGDLLISRSNTYELVGLVCLVKKPQPKLMLCDKTLRLVPDANHCSSAFLFFFLGSPAVAARSKCTRRAAAGA